MRALSARAADKPRRDNSTEPRTRAGWSSRMEVQGRSGKVPYYTPRHDKHTKTTTESPWQALVGTHMRKGTLPPLSQDKSCIYKVGKYGYTSNYKDALAFAHLKQLQTNQTVNVVNTLTNLS